jgi:hypothetical protein
VSAADGLVPLSPFAWAALQRQEEQPGSASGGSMAGAGGGSSAVLLRAGSGCAAASSTAGHGVGAAGMRSDSAQPEAQWQRRAGTGLEEQAQQAAAGTQGGAAAGLGRQQAWRGLQWALGFWPAAARQVAARRRRHLPLVVVAACLLSCAILLLWSLSAGVGGG